MTTDQHRSAAELNEVLDALDCPDDLGPLQAGLSLQRVGIRVGADELKMALHLRALRRESPGGDHDHDPAAA